MAREITYTNFDLSLVVFMPNSTTNHAITYTNRVYMGDALSVSFIVSCFTTITEHTYGNVFVLYNDQKRIKTDTHTGRLVSLDCSTICANLDILKSQTATFRLRFFFFSLSYL